MDDTFTRLRKLRKKRAEIDREIDTLWNTLEEAVNTEPQPGVDAPLGTRYERTFTSTWVGKKIRKP